MMSLLSRSFAYVVVSIGAALAPNSLFAQMDAPPRPSFDAVRGLAVMSPTPAVRVDSVVKAGPRVVRSSITAPSVSLSGVASLPGSDESLGAGRNVAMMGVGLAAIVVGSLVGGNGGTIIAIGGGVIGLVGLFRFLR